MPFKRAGKLSCRYALSSVPSVDSPDPASRRRIYLVMAANVAVIIIFQMKSSFVIKA